VIIFDVAGFPIGQLTLDVRMQSIWSPETGVYKYVGLFVPALIPLTFHWNSGDVPPLTGVAVYVTGMPEQTGLFDAVMVMLTGRFGLTVMIIWLDVAGLPLGQVTSEVRMQVIPSPFTGV
jgi:hypothetical protein